MTTAERSDRRPDHDVARPASSGRLAGFDGLRALAALSLVVFHAVLFSPGFTGSRTWGVVVQLRAGVWIFFVISGFLLYQPYVAAHRGTRPAPGLRSYAGSRLLRVYPAYLVALVLLTYVFHNTFVQTLPRFLTQLGLLQIYSLDALRRSIPLDVTWSLATEITFYVFLPAFAAAVARVAQRTGVLRAELTGLVAMVAVGVGWQVEMHGRSLQSTWLPSFLPVFAVGMGLAVASAHLPETAVPRLRSFGRRQHCCRHRRTASDVTTREMAGGRHEIRRCSSSVMIRPVGLPTWRDLPTPQRQGEDVRAAPAPESTRWIDCSPSRRQPARSM